MFEDDRWQGLLDHATDKGIELKTIKELCYPSNRQELFLLIANDQYIVLPPKIAKIPKDNGDFREVYVNGPRDRIVLALINDCLTELFPEGIHHKCMSYQKGMGTQTVVKKISSEIAKSKISGKRLGYKVDFTKYFDSVKLSSIEAIFNRLEDKLGFERGTEPVINLLRRYYRQNIYFDNEGNICEKYQSLKQGCAVAAFLSNVVMHDLDEYMSRKYKIYYRYCDDLVVLDNDTKNVIDEINYFVSKHGVTLNPKKVEPVYKDKWLKFLGFNIKGEMITLSKGRVKKFQREVEKRSVNQRHISADTARKQIFNYLYEGEHSWAQSCLATINVDKDIKELNAFILDCIRACETGKKKIGGLGSVNLTDSTIVRGTGKNVKKNKEKMPIVKGYISLQCLAKDIRISPLVFEAVVRGAR